MFVNFCLLVISLCCAVTATVLEQPATDFRRYSIVQPIVQHARTKRSIATTIDKNGLHHLELIMRILVDGEQYIFDLRMNQDLVTDNYVLSYQKDGETVLHKPKKEEMDLCHYSGTVRGKANSWVAVSTCHGIRGVIFDGKTTKYIEPTQGGNISSQHYMYDHTDLTKWHQCGNDNTTTNNSNNEHKSRIYRYKRHSSDTQARGPYNANKLSRYVELVLVADSREFAANDYNIHKVRHEMKTLANIINSIYTPLNIFIALVGVVVWTEDDKIDLLADSDETLRNFMKYRKTVLVNDIPNDNAHLLTRQVFLDSVIGKANTHGICRYGLSGGVETNHSPVVGLVASTIAHEMGHNFGMDHDNEDCECPDKKCIMSPSSSSFAPVRWSSCSLKSLALSFGSGLDHCLRNKPKQLIYDLPNCGNGFVDPGEQCDCGIMRVASVNNPCHACCEPSTCKFRSNATCANGMCCDLKTCRPKTAGTICRSADRECDLPEYCTGRSEYCPDDVYKMDTTPCGEGKQSAYCMSGSCRSQFDQCRLIWGITGKNGHRQCYERYNHQGNEYGHCGYDRSTNWYIKCKPEHALCGVLKCFNFADQTQIPVTRSYKTNYQDSNRVLVCHSVDVDMEITGETDLGMVPDGAKCGDEKMCLKQRCESVVDVRKRITETNSFDCATNCSGHGVCNSAGHCHCDPGFAPPLCSLPGPGGSYESGPATDPANAKRVMIALYVIFLGIIPSIILVIFLLYYFRPKALVCCDVGIRKLKTYFKLNTSNSNAPHIYANVAVNLPETEVQDCKIKSSNNIKSNHLSNKISVKPNYEPIYVNNEPIYVDYKLKDRIIPLKSGGKINKNDIQVVKNITDIETTDKINQKGTRTVFNDNEINKTSERARRQINENNSIASKRTKVNDGQMTRNKISTDHIHNVQQKKGNSTGIRDVQDGRINSGKNVHFPDKTLYRCDIQKVTKVDNLGDEKRLNKDDHVATKSRIRNNKPILKSTQTEDNLPKESRTGVSVKSLSSAINAANNQQDINNKTYSNLKNKQAIHGLKK